MATERWVVTELSLALAGPPSEGEVHPETTPVGPFVSREAADSWARAYVASFGGSGSWSVAPLRAPVSTGWPDPSSAPGSAVP